MFLWLHRYAVLTACVGFFLVIAGGLVTSTGSGLAVPDWPLSYGQLFPPMVGGIFYEHGHRMVASTVGFLTVILAFWVGRRDSRRSVRTLGYVALAAVIAQGILGGLTVIFLLPTPISVGHACLGQAFFCLLVALAFLTSKRWSESISEKEEGGEALSRSALVLTVVVFAQLVLGAVVRHTGAALAIPDFPLAFGRWIPSVFSEGAAIHFAHRLGALVVALVTIGYAIQVWRSPRSGRFLKGFTLLAFSLVLIQILLGGLIVWTERSVWTATAHVATGALILASSVIMSLWSARRFGLELSALRHYGMLVKPRVTFMVCITAMIGFYSGSRGPFFVGRFLLTILATALVAGGASALNQYMERDVDGRMRRTAGRPLPSGHLTMRDALSFGWIISAIGLVLFWFTVGHLAALLAFVALGSYLGIYTPLKRVTPWCTMIGAVPGAIPTLIGWAGATGGVSVGAWVLFGILFLWQLPHFLAIAWLYRDDYASASLLMLPVVDRTGRRTAVHLLAFSIALVPVAILPGSVGVAGPIYASGAAALSLVFLIACIFLAVQKTLVQARRVLMMSVLYLPLLYALLVVDKV